MTKINKEEYWFLEGLNDGWKWIAKDKNTSLWVYEKEPRKYEDCWDEFMGTCEMIDSPLFQFIQWEDEEPYNIAELIEEYESEGIEVNKDIDWLKKEITEILLTSKKDGTNYFYYRDLKEKIYNAIDQIDEPEVLSPDWIKENEKSIDYRSTVTGQFVEANKLQNIIVPKRELPVIPKFVSGWIEETKKQNLSYIYAIAQMYDKYETGESLSEEENRIFEWMEAYDNDEVFARAWLDGYTVKKEPKYLALIKGHENIGSADKYWNYCITDESLEIGGNGVHTDVLAEYVLSATKDRWENLGINDDNADFVKVEELEE